MDLPKEEEIYEAYLGKAAAEMVALSELISNCRNCEFGKEGKRPVPGAGYPLADLFILKGQLCEEEAENRVAFAGAAAEILWKALSKLEIDFSLVYATNAVKCVAEEKKTAKAHVEACFPYLREEIAFCEPRVILAMGPMACYALGLAEGSLERIEYQPGHISKLLPDLHVVVTVDFETALETETTKKRLWQDLVLTKDLIEKDMSREQGK